MIRLLILSATLLAHAGPSLAAASTEPALKPEAAACKPSPLGSRDLYLRGSFNNWSARDEHRFSYVCNRFELHARIRGEHSFKIGDEDWSADADFGGSADRLELKGGALKRDFTESGQRLVLRMSTAQDPARLQIDAFDGPLPPRPASTLVTDKVALSVHFDSRSSAHKKPFGAVTAGSRVEFALRADPAVSRATLVIEKRRLEGNQELLEYQPLARVAMKRSASGWQADYRFSDMAVYGYYFELEIGAKRYVYGNNKNPVYWTREKGTMGVGLIDALPESERPSPSQLRRYRQTVYAADFKVPDWARDAIYYYIFPERFRNGDRSNDPKLGRDRYQNHGIETHPTWIGKPYKPGSGDGSDAVYNNDFFGGDLAGIIEKLDYIASTGANTLYMTPVFQAASNHKYDTGDYTRIDPAFGTNADFERLSREAARRGIRVIADTSLNHVGSDSPYFNRYGNFPAGGAFDGGKLNPDSPYASWFTLDPSKPRPEDQYQGWVGEKDLPELNKNSKDFRAFAYGRPDSVTQQWLDRGAAGWRMDVAPWVPDDFWREWRLAVKSHRPDALTIAETWFDASKHLLGDMFDTSMNYIFRSTVLDYVAGGDARKLYANLELVRESYPPQAYFGLMNLLSSHDQSRALHHFGYHDDGNTAKLAQAKKRLRLALLFQMSFPGAPAIYYGDEVGLAGGEDPYNRAPYPWADEGGQPDLSLLEDFKRMTAMRQANPVLRHGSLAAPLHLDAQLIVLVRRDGKQWAITATNNAERARSVSVRLPAGFPAGSLRDALDGTPLPQKAGRITLKLPPLSGRVLLSQ